MLRSAFHQLPKTLGPVALVWNLLDNSTTETGFC